MKKYADSTLKSRTKKELIGIIRCLEHSIECIEEMNANQFKLLMEKEKYRWHDLRKNPEDLPMDEYKIYLTIEKGILYPMTSEGAWIRRVGASEVIAWREIEPFEEEEE